MWKGYIQPSIYDNSIRRPMMSKKSIFMFFILFLLIGNLAGSIIVYYWFGRVSVAEFIALYTSILTAIYTILANQKRE